MVPMLWLWWLKNNLKAHDWFAESFRTFRNNYYLVRPEIWLSDIWEIHKCKCEEITKYITSVKIILTVFSIVEASIQNALKDCGLWKPSLLLWKHHSSSKSGSIIFAANEKFAFVLISYQDVADNRLIYTFFLKKCIQNIQFFKIVTIFCFLVILELMKIVTYRVLF